jgi:hypothetical protein
MRSKQADKGLVIIAVNTESPQSKPLREKVIEFLREEKIALVNVAASSETELEAMLEKVNGLPTTFVYGRDGKQAKTIEGADLEEIHKVVGELLGKN